MRINKKFMELILNVVSLPSVYKLNNIKLILVLVFLLINSLIVSSGLIYKIDSEIIQVSIVYFSIFYLFYILFNIIIRIYNTLIRTVRYFIKHFSIFYIKIIISYYIYNIICLILTSILIYKLYNSLLNYDPTIINYLYIYLFYLLVISLIYIDYISDKEVQFKCIKIHKFSYKLIILNIILILTTIYGLFQFSLWNIIMKDKVLSDKYIKIIIFNLMESDTNTESSDSINVIRQENTNEQSTPYSEESNKNAARQKNINSQSGDRNVVIQSNDNRQTFHNSSPNYNSHENVRREITRGRSSERISRNIVSTQIGSDTPPRYNENENEESIESELVRKHEVLTEWINSSKRTVSRTSIDDIDELLLMSKNTQRSFR
jgi:hypothetical protein